MVLSCSTTTECSDCLVSVDSFFSILDSLQLFCTPCAW